MNGADFVTIRDLLWYSDIRMTSRYAHSSDDLKRKGVKSLADMMKNEQKEVHISQIIPNLASITMINPLN